MSVWIAIAIAEYVIAGALCAMLQSAALRRIDKDQLTSYQRDLMDAAGAPMIIARILSVATWPIFATDMIYRWIRDWKKRKDTK